MVTRGALAEPEAVSAQPLGSEASGPPESLGAFEGDPDVAAEPVAVAEAMDGVAEGAWLGAAPHPAARSTAAMGSVQRRHAPSRDIARRIRQPITSPGPAG